MSKIVVIPNSKNDINEILANDCYILVGIDGYSVNTFNISLDYLKELLSVNNNIFVSLNKNISNSELVGLEELLDLLSDLDIRGIFYYDVALVNIVKRKNLKINLIWSAEHLTTNYFTINYWSKHGVKGTFLSNEITFDEIVDISNNTNCELFVQVFGYIPMYVSKRHAIKNYLKYFSIDDDSHEYHLYKEDKKYSIVDNDEGTMIYSNFILNGLRESLTLNNKVDYIVLNAYKIDNIISVIGIYKEVTNDNVVLLENRLNSMFNNLDKGFLYEETIYRVKKNDK